MNRESFWKTTLTTQSAEKNRRKYIRELELAPEGKRLEEEDDMHSVLKCRHGSWKAARPVIRLNIESMSW